MKKHLVPVSGVGRRMNGLILMTVCGLVLGLVGTPPVSSAATGVDFMGVGKFDFHVQSSAQVPVPDPAGRFGADVFVEASSGAGVSGVTVSRPNGIVRDLERDEPGGAYWSGGEEFSQRSERDAAFPDGVYTFAIATAGHGKQQVTLNLVGNAFPTAPRVSNYSQAQAIDAEEAFTLAWDPFAGAGAEDFIVIGIEDSESGEEIFHSGFLPATDHSVELPAGLFQPDREYGVYLIFANITDTDEETFAGGKAIAGYFSETWLDIRTRGAAGVGVDFYGVVKLNRYVQPTAFDVRPMDDDAFMGEIFVEPSGADTVVGASVSVSGEAEFLLEKESSEGAWRTETRSAERAERDREFPNGTYEFRIETTEGERTVPLILAGDTYPNVPRLGNHGAAQAIDSGETFTLFWDAFSGAGADDFIIIGIEDPMDDFETVFESDFLSADLTSVEIPAGTLKPGRIYEAWITFARVTDKDEKAFAEWAGIAAYLSETMTHIRTQANPGPGDGIDSFAVLKIALHRQTDAGSPEPDTEGSPYEFHAFVDEAASGALAGVGTIGPDGEVRLLNERDFGSGFLQAKRRFASRAALDAMYPNGIYTLNISGPDEGKHVSFHLTGDAYPSPVRVGNFEKAQAIHPGRAFTLSWELSDGTGGEDSIVVGIEDPLSGETVFDSGFLPGDATSVEFPAGTLQPDRVYSVSISLVRAVDSDGVVFPNASGIAGYVASTLLQIRTGDGGGLTFADWAEPLPPDERGPTDDPGGRGIFNLLRYAFALDPVSPERSGLPRIGLSSPAGGAEAPRLAVTFTRRRDAADLRYAVEVSSDLIEWNELLDFSEVIDREDEETQTVTVAEIEPVSVHKVRFLRVRVMY